MNPKLFLTVILIFIGACAKGSDASIDFENQNQKVCETNLKNWVDKSILDSDVTSDRVNSNENFLDMDTFVTPTEKVPSKDWPSIYDDLNFDSMDEALIRQINRYQKMSSLYTVKLGKEKYRLNWIIKSHQTFLSMIEDYKICVKNNSGNCQNKFEDRFKSNFELYRPQLAPGDPRFNEPKPALFTAYYTPTIKGSKVKNKIFKHAVYKRPIFNAEVSRVEIDFDGALANRGLELFYTDDLFKLYLMHIEGGGFVEMSANSSDNSYLSYDGTNDMTWRFISSYMLEMNYIKNQSVEAQSIFLKKNPLKHKEIYSSCPSYVYFKKSDHEPLGSDSVPLTSNRSIATDRSYYKFKGLLTFVKAKRPIGTEGTSFGCSNSGFKDFSRFYLDQDTGGAIRGKARADLYFGQGDYAELAAHSLVERGEIYFAVLKP